MENIYNFSKVFICDSGEVVREVHKIAGFLYPSIAPRSCIFKMLHTQTNNHRVRKGIMQNKTLEDVRFEHNKIQTKFVMRLYQ